jgi:branched-chain amino acid transport system permease protein
MPVKKLALSVGVLILVALVVFPQVTGNTYLISLVLTLFMYVVLAQSYDIVGGHLGYMNLGHISFFGLGAYVFSILVIRNYSPVAAVFAAAAAGVLLALLTSYPFFRLRGAYFALATLGVILLFHRLAFNLEDLTQGTAGISLPPKDSLVQSYYLGYVLMLVVLATSLGIARSRFGLALRTIREDEPVAETFGVNCYYYKAVALTISGIFPTLMGCLFAWWQKYIHPDSVFGLEIALFPIAMAMLGGTGAIFGPLVGALFLTGVEDLIWANVKVEYGKLTAYGLVLVLVAIAMPQGMIRTRWFRRPLRFLGLEEHAL